MSRDPTIRARHDCDLPSLVELLAHQQPHSRYPLRWPLPFPPERFLVRANEEHAWVATIGDTVVGHVALTTADDPKLGPVWSAGAQRPVNELVCVSVLFVDHERRGSGIGGRLLDTAVAAALEQGRTPVLDVVQSHGTAVEVYRHRGWIEVGRARPSWLPDTEPPILLMVLPTQPAPS